MPRLFVPSLSSFCGALSFLLVANVFDAGLTALWISAGIVEEGNAVMAAALEQGYGVFVLSKVGLVGLGALGLYRLRARPLARLAVVPGALLYSFVLGTHVGIGARVVGLVETGLVFGGRLPGA
jgi:hypothetical protein